MRNVLALGAAGLLLALSACAGPVQSEATSVLDRAELYADVPGLAAASTAVVRGVVVAQEPGPTTGGEATTVSTIRVAEHYAPEGLGAAGTPPPEIEVQQYGTAEATPAGAGPLLADGGEYVLFLVDQEAGVAWITGQTAGLYTVGADRTTIERVVTEGDTLPPTSPISVLWADPADAPATLAPA